MSESNSVVAAPAWLSPMEPAPYETIHVRSSYSGFVLSLTFPPVFAEADFARQIAEVYAVLSEGQEPLGADFEAVWDANVDILYES
ncbi:MAG: hypothetical protein P9C55_15170 [Defluviicoccus sp.]|nr:hypothetical protein [Defluviicoccus sp.]